MNGSTVYTTDILMPEVWFDGDSTYISGATPKPLNPNEYKPTATEWGGIAYAEHFLAKDGKIYINFNEPVRKNNGVDFSTDAATQNTELKACLFVHEGTLPGINRNSDTPWTGLTGYGYTAALSTDKKQIVITPDSSWNSSDTIWVKIKNSKIEDYTGNEIVPYGNLYVQSYKVENYLPPLVRYTYGTIWDELDSMTNVHYNLDGNPTKAVAPITVTVSGKIYVPATANVEGYPESAGGVPAG